MFSTETIVRMAFPDKADKYQWMVDCLNTYGVAERDFCGWQVELKGRRYVRRSSGWVEVDTVGKVMLRKVA